MSIRSRILAGCIALTLLTGLTGLIAQQAERRLGRLALDIYDNGFMGVSYLREAQLAFADLAAHPSRLTPQAIDDLLGDLDVVATRATSARARAEATRLQQGLRQALPLLGRTPALVPPLQARFALLVEVFADDGFRYRQQVQRLVGTQLRRTASVLAVAVLAALVITGLLGRLIAPPVLRAVRVAQRIAGGDLHTPIDTAGRGETGDLLRALATMQASIAEAMERIRTLMDREAEARLAYMARHDAATALPNRLGFVEHAAGLLADPAAQPRLALLCLQLDRFHVINDSMGHACGDALLRAVAARLAAVIGPADRIMRLGPDTLAIVQDAPEQPHAAACLAPRLLQAIEAPFEIAAHTIQAGATIGVALPAPGADGSQATPEAWQTAAELALHRAGQQGAAVQVFEPWMNQDLQERRILEQDLRHALQHEELVVYYQPLLTAAGGISGFEALVRWRHPLRGMVSPGEFIGLAEEIGLIRDIGSWVLRRACADCAAWGPSLKVAVNLSPIQFRGGGLTTEVLAALQAARLPPTRLELEITESVLLQDDAVVMDVLHALRRHGIRIAMDDFGTGYSSLGYLRRFPFDKIKIDQSFVRGLCDDNDSRAIVRAVVGLGRSLGIAVNAEGVETQAQHDALVAEGVSELQGYLFSKPQPDEAVPALLRRFGVATPAQKAPAALLTA